MIRSFEELVDRARQLGPAKIAVIEVGITEGLRKPLLQGCERTARDFSKMDASSLADAGGKRQ